MPDDLVGRIAQDVAAGKAVDWTAALASATTDTERKQIESLRMLERIGRLETASAGPAALASTLTAGPFPQTQLPGQDGARWGRYTLVEEAGSGSYGRVYRAFDPDLDLDVAVKVLHRHVQDDLLRERLLKEGRALAKIRHQNVVRVIGIEFNGDRVGLCTEFVHGDTLEQEVRTHGTFSEAEAIEIGKAVCQALAAVHRAGFLHKDVKARNVMRERDTGRIVLMDFGTGRELTEELALGGFGIEGTAIYMAPEMLDGYGASHATDVYSVAVLLYYLLTAAYPVEGRSPDELRTAHARGLRTPLGERRPDLSPGFLQVIERGLSAPTKRQAIPSVLCADLEGLDSRPPLWLQRIRTTAIVVASVAGAVLSLGFINTFYLNTALGRGSFVDEGILDWFTWGAKGMLAPVVVTAFTVLATALIVELIRLLVRISGHARMIQRWIAARVHKYSLDDVEVLSSVSLLASASVLFVAWWYFAPLLGTLTSIVPDISTIPLEKLTLLSPDYADYHLTYRKAFLGTTIACVMLWYPTVRLAIRTRQRVPRRTAAAGGIVLAFSLLFLDFPYRLLAHDVDFEEVSWENRSCHVLGSRGDERLIFCASLPIPRSRVVRADAIVPHPSPADAPGDPPGGAAAKRKRSIFKFLLNNREPQPSRSGAFVSPRIDVWEIRGG
jgi:serine/threonine protein kinase